MPRKVKKEAAPKNKKRTKYAIQLIVNFVWMFVLYRAVLIISEKFETIIPYAICATVYIVAATVMLCIYYFATSGETDAENKEKYKPLIVWSFPIVVVLLLDVMETVVLDYIINLF